MTKRWVLIGLVIIAVTAFSGILGGLTGGYLAYVYLIDSVSVNQSIPAPLAAPASSLNIVTTQNATTVTQAVEKVGPAVINSLFSYSPGQTIPVTLIRDNHQLELNVTLGEVKN